MRKKKERIQAIEEVHALFREVRMVLKIDREQPIPGLMFDIMEAVDKASKLLDQAWKIGSLYKITDDDMREEFIEVFAHFRRIRRDITKEVKGKN